MTSKSKDKAIEGEIIHVDPDVLPEKLNLGNLALHGPQQLIDRATQMAVHLRRIIDKQELYTQIGKSKHVHVEGWTTMLSLIGVTPREEGSQRFQDGTWEVTVGLYNYQNVCVGRAASLCGVDEKDREGNLTWANKPEYARRSMAATRATGKAARLSFSWIMKLAGYAPTPWEEVQGFEPFKNGGSERKPSSNGLGMPSKQDASPGSVAAYGQRIFDHLQNGGTIDATLYWNFSKYAEFDQNFANGIREEYTQDKNTDWVSAFIRIAEEWNKNAERSNFPQINMTIATK